MPGHFAILLPRDASLLSPYGRTPIIRAPMKPNAAKIIKALIGLASPMHILLFRATAKI